GARGAGPGATEWLALVAPGHARRIFRDYPSSPPLPRRYLHQRWLGMPNRLLRGSKSPEKRPPATKSGLNGIHG
ncbi:hypothetical protein JY423_19430, partial [Stenotrophomonas maltophilia]|nr:hypothetical protein [Stenotrophomonas maltophilia]